MLKIPLLTFASSPPDCVIRIQISVGNHTTLPSFRQNTAKRFVCLLDVACLQVRDESVLVHYDDTQIAAFVMHLCMKSRRFVVHLVSTVREEPGITLESRSLILITSCMRTWANLSHHNRMLSCIGPVLLST